jgi:alpha-mannosidase
MTTDNFRQHLASFELMSDAEACDFVGYPDDKTPNVRVVEDGDVRTRVQAFFKYNRSTAMVEYTMPKHSNYMDVDILVFSGEPNKMLKYHIDTAFEGVPVGETAFGREELFHDEREAFITNGAAFTMPKIAYTSSIKAHMAAVLQTTR